MTTNPKWTPGPWDFAADSYGKVQHSRKACVFTTIKGQRGDHLINIASRIQNWDDAKLIAAAPDMAEALQAIIAADHPSSKGTVEQRRAAGIEQARAALAKAGVNVSR